MKIINTVLDTRAMVLQLRTDHTTADYCMYFFNKLFKACSFRKYYFDEVLIRSVKKRLLGNTYEYIGLKEYQELNKSSIIEKKTLKKFRLSKEELQASLDFRAETTARHFDLECEKKDVNGLANVYTHAVDEIPGMLG